MEKKKFKRIVACPSCRASVVFDVSNEWRPFCSERCKTQDIAAWADEAFKIPGKPHFDESSDSPKEEDEQDP